MSNRSEILKKEYRLRFEQRERYRSAVWKTLCNQFFSKYIPRDSVILDLGAGWGEFINNIGASKKLAIDLNPETEKRLSPDVRFLNQDCSATWDIASNSLDVVFTSNFIEHLPDKDRLEQTIDEAYRCLKPNGLILCLGPNIKYVPGAYWDFWDHHIPLTEASLMELLTIKGFRNELCIPRFLPYTMSSGATPPLIALKLYLRLPLVWPLFGKQFLVMGRKSADAS